MAGRVSDTDGASRTVPLRLQLVAAALGLAMLAGCATPPPSPPPVAFTPPPPPVQLIPPRPVPPMGAAAMMAIPPVGLDGQRLTVNTGLTAAQTTWNLRSALNVAALNCDEPEYAALVGNYTIFLDRFERPLRTTSSKILEEFRAKYGRAQGQPEFDNYMTQVYNYFALPPSLRQFCNAALTVSADSTLVAPADLDSFAARVLPQLEAVFEDFFRSYESYERNLANWSATYGPGAVPGTPVPEWVRTGARGPTAGEQVLYRETAQGSAYPESVGTVEVLPAPVQVAPEQVPVVVARSPDAGQALPEAVATIDPGASDAVAADMADAADAPAPAAGGIVFTSNPVVQTSPEGEN